MSDTDWATPSEIAKEYRLSTATIYRLLESGKIQAVRIGGSWRINRAETIRAATPSWPTFAEHCAPMSERRG
ncbi:MAG TPA: helix-turn-helix domain-containing protein [Candidatus Acidoferrales bacterium]|nr:helix-turn-helix domain-containing protein [Candidatus Acidoferrales bacterium]